MDRYFGIFGIIAILGIAFLLSNNKKAIDKKLVFTGLLIQALLAVFILKVPLGQIVFAKIGYFITMLLDFSNKGADFVFGPLVNSTLLAPVFGISNTFIFFFKIIPTIIFVSVLVSIAYHIGIMQRIVAVFAKVVHKLMGVSGSEALSNVGSAFVGQVEAQVMIRPYLPTMTKSEILASMSGSLACIAGGILVVYANMGAQAGMDLAPKLITASLMAAPGALVIAKILFPETEASQTMGKVTLEVKSQYSNTIDAITHGAGDGFKIAMNVIAMLIGFIALIALVDWSLLKIGHLFSANVDLSLNFIFSKLFYPMAWAMGIPNVDVQNAATLLGQKLTINEFVAFKSLTSKVIPIVTEKGLLIVSIAICGFANFSSVGMLIGGIGELAPTRRKDLAELGLKALLAGTLASYLSASIAGILIG